MSSEGLFEQLSGLTRNLGSLSKGNSGSGEESSSIFKMITGNGITQGSSKDSGASSGEGSSSGDMLKSLLGGSEEGLKGIVKSQITGEDGKISPEKAMAAAGAIIGGVSKISSLLNLKKKEKVKSAEEESSSTGSDKEDPMSFWKSVSNQLDGKNTTPQKEDKKGGKSKLSSLAKSIKEKVLTGKENKEEGLKKEGFKISDLNPLKLFKSNKQKSEEEKVPEKENSKEGKGIFARLKEKISGKSEKGEKSETTKDIGGKEEGKKSKLGQKIENIKTKIGSALSKFKEEGDEEERGAMSDLKKESPSLSKIVSSKKESEKKSEESPSKSTTETSESSSGGSKPTGTTPGDKSPEGSSSKKQDSSQTSPSKEGGISPQDIQDIKTLLSSINTTLNGPLTVKDNKPFRPKSSMLE